jgi:hypothetical protein
VALRGRSEIAERHSADGELRWRRGLGVPPRVDHPGAVQRVTSASALGLAHRGEQIATRLPAATANLRADAAAIMVRRVALALNGARTTHDDARLDRYPNDAQIDFGLAGQDAADASQTSARSRLSRMDRISSNASGSPRQASAQPMHVAEQS